MAKRKTPKTKLENGTVEITIDGAKVVVPVLVKKLLDDQRRTLTYFEHLLSLWHYKEYNEETATEFAKELATFVQENITEFDERIKQFEKADKENLENSEVN